MTISEAALTGIAERYEQIEREVKLLRLLNEKLEGERLNAELKASLKIARQAETIADFRSRIEELERAQDSTNNFVQGNCVQRSEFRALEEQVAGVSANVSI